MTLDPALTIDAVTACRQRLGKRIRETPTIEWPEGARSLLGPGCELLVKLEFLQVTGSFKARGALNVVDSLNDAEKEKGIVAVSAGNHAIAAAYAASVSRCSAKVVMPGTASPIHIQRARSYGAEVVLARDVHHAFDLLAEIVQAEGRTSVHPFEGPLTSQGTGTLGLELLSQAGDLDVLILPIGGGGLASGVAAVAKQLNPRIRTIGIEPEGADAMRRSREQGVPVRLEQVQTIADSLAPPMALPFSFGTCEQVIDEIRTVSDEEIRQAMRLLMRDLRVAVEPAAAAATAALMSGRGGQFRGLRVGMAICGSNLDVERIIELVSAEGGNH